LGVLLSAADFRLEEGLLYIHPPTGDTLMAGALQRPANVDALTRAISETWGPGVEWKLAAATAKKASSRKSTRATDQTKASERDIPAAVQIVLDVFDGKIES
jgi:hypothetical protein